MKITDRSAILAMSENTTVALRGELFQPSKFREIRFNSLLVYERQIYIAR